MAMTAHKPVAAALLAVSAHLASPAEPSAVAGSSAWWQLHAACCFAAACNACWHERVAMTAHKPLAAALLAAAAH